MLEPKEVFDQAESYKEWLLRSKDYFNDSGLNTALYLNFKWLISILDEAELNSVDPIIETIYKKKPKISIEGEIPYSKVTYRDNTYYIFNDDSGQCMTLYYNNEFISLGTYNFNYLLDVKYILRYNYFVNVLK